MDSIKCVWIRVGSKNLKSHRTERTRRSAPSPTRQTLGITVPGFLHLLRMISTPSSLPLQPSGQALQINGFLHHADNAAVPVWNESLCGQARVLFVEWIIDSEWPGTRASGARRACGFYRACPSGRRCDRAARRAAQPLSLSFSLSFFDHARRSGRRRERTCWAAGVKKRCVCVCVCDWSCRHGQGSCAHIDPDGPSRAHPTFMLDAP